MFVQTMACFPVTHEERRRETRRRPAQETVCQLSEDGGTAVGTGLVWNLSRTGVSMLVAVRLDPGAEVAANLVSVAGRHVRRGLRVVHVSRLQTGDFVLGGKFDHDLDDEELGAFVA